MKLLFGLGFVFAMIGLSGCNKMSEAQKAQLSTVALIAKERASAFAAVKSQLKAKDQKVGQFVSVMMDRHGNGLNADALALADFVGAVQKGSALDKKARQALLEMGKTMSARAANFKIALSLDIAAEGELLVFLQSHLSALESTAAALSALAGELKPKESPK